MEDESHGDAAAGEVPATRKTHRKKLPAPKLSAMIPFALGCAAPIPILMAAMDKVPGEGRPPKTPVLYEFNVLFKLCGICARPPRGVSTHVKDSCRNGQHARFKMSVPAS